MSFPSLGTPVPRPCPGNGRGGSGPCWKSLREEREGTVPLVLNHKVLPGPTPIMQLLSSPYLSLLRILATLLSPPPRLLSRLEKPQSRQSQWKKVPIVQLLCLSFPIPKTHQLPPHDLLWLRPWTAAARENPRSGCRLFPAASGSPEGRDVTARSACPAQPRPHTS